MEGIHSSRKKKKNWIRILRRQDSQEKGEKGNTRTKRYALDRYSRRDKKRIPSTTRRWA